jgi:hypothetical protein
MYERAAGVGFPLLFGIYLIYENIAESSIFSAARDATYHSTLLALGAFLLAISVLFLIKILR